MAVATVPSKENSKDNTLLKKVLSIVFFTLIAILMISLLIMGFIILSATQLVHSDVMKFKIFKKISRKSADRYELNYL